MRMHIEARHHWRCVMALHSKRCALEFAAPPPSRLASRAHNLSAAVSASAAPHAGRRLARPLCLLQEKLQHGHQEEAHETLQIVDPLASASAAPHACRSQEKLQRGHQKEARGALQIADHVARSLRSPEEKQRQRRQEWLHS